MAPDASAAAYEDVELASDDDLAEGVRVALDRLGVSYDELRDQAEREKFQSEDARLVWFMLAPPDGARC
jgi:hypothetical protein